MLLPFSLAPPPIKIHLVDATGCKYYLHAQFANDQVGAFLSDRPNVHPIAVPELNEWLTDNEAPQYPYKKNWPTGNHDPWLIFHTSGTTGKPLSSFV